MKILRSHILSSVTAGLTLCANPSFATDQTGKERAIGIDHERNNIGNLREQWKRSLSGYLDTHNLQVEDLSTDLQISWATVYRGRPYWGTLQSTGSISDIGCPEFDVISISGGATATDQIFLNESICID